MRRRAALLLLAALAPCAAAAPLVMKARTFDGLAWRDGVTEVVVDAGVIRSITALPEGSAPDIPGAVLTQGLVDHDSALGLSDGREEPQEAVSPDLLVADAFAPDESESRALARSGVTTAWLCGGSTSLLSGAGALVAPSTGPARVVSRRHGACGSLASSARLPERAPTSPPEQLDLLRSMLPAGPVRARVRFDDGTSAATASTLAGVLLVGLPDSPETARQIEGGAGAGLILSTDWAHAPQDRVRLAAALVHGRVALGSGASAAGPLGLRIAAHALVQAGAPREAVLAALTRRLDQGAAPDAGLRPGAPADLVLWSGDPTSLASRVLVVWVSGVEVYRAPAREAE
jgi:imidazolonepropionase-like amidohydrolase